MKTLTAIVIIGLGLGNVFLIFAHRITTERANAWKAKCEAERESVTLWKLRYINCWEQHYRNTEATNVVISPQ